MGAGSHSVRFLVLVGAALWLALFVSAFLTSVDSANSLKFAGKMAIGWLLFLVVIDTLRDRPDRVNLLVGVFCLNSVAVSVVGIGEILSWGWAEALISLFRTQRFFVGHAVRLSSTLEYPNTAAVFLGQALVLAPFLGLAGGHKKLFSLRSVRCGLWMAVFVIVTMGLILTYFKGRMAGERCRARDGSHPDLVVPREATCQRPECCSGLYRSALSCHGSLQSVPPFAGPFVRSAPILSD